MKRLIYFAIFISPLCCAAEPPSTGANGVVVNREVVLPLVTDAGERSAIIAVLPEGERKSVRSVSRIGLFTVLVVLGPVPHTSLMSGVRIFQNKKGAWTLVASEDHEG